MFLISSSGIHYSGDVIGQGWVILLYDLHQLVESQLDQPCFLLKAIYAIADLLVNTLVFQLPEVVNGKKL